MTSSFKKTYELILDCSHESLICHAVVPVTHDDVIMKTDINACRGDGHLPCDDPVLNRWDGIARWVVMRHHNRVGAVE